MKQQSNIWQFEQLGTKWSIETPRLLDNSVQQMVLERLDTFDRMYSRFRDDSLVTQMRRPGIYTVPDDFASLWRLYEQLYDVTDGRVTPLVGRMLEQAGYDADYSLQSGQIDPVSTLAQAVTWDGANTVDIHHSVTIDVGAAGKGYAVDIVAEILETMADSTEYVIDASGDIRHRGDDDERIGLEHPNDPTKVIGVAKVRNRSLCASAVNRRAWRNMHHIIDPVMRQSVRDIVATWVVADTTMVADGLATALFFVDAPERLREIADFEYVRMTRDGTVDYSPGFDGELFI